MKAISSRGLQHKPVKRSEVPLTDLVKRVDHVASCFFAWRQRKTVWDASSTINFIHAVAWQCVWHKSVNFHWKSILIKWMLQSLCALKVHSWLIVSTIFIFQVGKRSFSFNKVSLTPQQEGVTCTFWRSKILYAWMMLHRDCDKSRFHYILFAIDVKHWRKFDSYFERLECFDKWILIGITCVMV